VAPPAVTSEDDGDLRDRRSRRIAKKIRQCCVGEDFAWRQEDAAWSTR
jgi:hypothetical protein